MTRPNDPTADLATGPKWDARYAAPDYIFGEAPNAFLASQARHFKPGMAALVPGDGEGRNGVWLAGLGLDVTTVDASRVGVEKSRRLAAARGLAIDAIHADLEQWAWPEARYDLVVSIFLHFHPEPRRRLHALMLRALRPGGLIVLEAYTPRQLEHRKAGIQGGPPPEMLFTADLLRVDFGTMDVIELGEVDTTLAEGKRHVGPASVVRLVARRR